jgi:biopolymer transport protein ExbD
LPLSLPQAKTGETKSTSLAISIDQGGQLFLDGRALSSTELRARVIEERARGDVSALIAADGRAAHKSVVRVIDLIRSEGVTKFAINVAPEDLEP